MRKRGQITLFVIIGILLVLVVTIIISLQNVAAKNRLDAQASSMIEEFVQTNALNHYVTSCLDKVASEGINLLASQGGVIYESQGGLTPDKTDIDEGVFFEEGIQYYPYSYVLFEGNDFVTHKQNISYAIRPYVNCPQVVWPRPINLSDETTADYPVAKTSFADYVSRYNNFYFSQPPGCNLLDRKTTWSGFLGLNNLEPLCSYDGPNVGTGVCNALYGFDSPTHPYSFERQLTNYIEQQLPVCVDFDIYQDILGSNITIMDEPNVSIRFQQPRGLNIQVTYPFIVSVEGKNPITKQVNFQKNMPLNLNRFFNYMYILIKNAVRDPYFSLATDWNDSLKNPFYNPSYVVSISQPTLSCNSAEHKRFVCMDKVLLISDYSSLLFGKPITFQFAIRQRKPVLDYLHDPNQFSIINNKQIDYQYQVNDAIPLEIFAMDPDADNINITISGWKQTYDDFFNIEECKNKEVRGCNLSNHWKYVKAISMPEGEPKWTDSLVFQSPSFSSTYQTDEDDIGLHNVTVIVEDEHGQKDFQIVHLLIFDLPKAVLKFRNIYDDISDNIASVEDSFILDGSQSSASTLAQGSLTDFIFIDETEPFTYQTPNANSVLELPLGSTSVENITLGWFTRSGLLSSIKKQHAIKLIIKQGDIATSLPDAHKITVAQCLPHGYIGYEGDPSFNKDSFSKTPYPFYSGDSYEASHVCCEPLTHYARDELPTTLGAGKYAPDSMICFAHDFVTSYPFDSYELLSQAVKDNDEGLSQPITPELYGFSYVRDVYGNINFVHDADDINFRADNLNDIYKVHYEQSCSGKRGNVCGGDIDTTWTTIECDDFRTTKQFARCQGPSIPKFNEETIEQTCTLYNGASFENRLYYSLNTEQEDIKKAFEDFYDPTTAEYIIQDGFCAGPASAILTRDASIQTVNIDGDYACMAECVEGNCAYTKPALCQCDNNNICDTYHASDFIDDTGHLINYLCKGSSACLNSCTVADEDSPEACSCRTGTYMAGACCELGANNFATSSSGCLNGQVLSSGEIAHQSTFGSDKVLFCKGVFYVCTQDSTLATAPPLPTDASFEYSTESQQSQPCIGGPVCRTFKGGSWSS